MTQKANTLYPLALGYVTAKAIAIAAEHCFDTLLSQEGMTIEALANELKFNVDALGRLLRVLDVHDIVKLNEHQVYPTELTGQLADIRSPHYIKTYKIFDELEYTLKTHQPAWEKVYGQAFYPSLDQESLDNFALWCQRTGEVWLAGLFKMYDFSKYKTVVDIAGGNGHFLAEMLSRTPNQCGILFDQQAVVDSAKKVFLKHNCLEQVKLLVAISLGQFLEMVTYILFVEHY